VRRAAFAVLGTAIGSALLIGAKLGTPTAGTGTQVALEDTDGAAAGAAGEGAADAGGATSSPKPASRDTPTTKATTKPPARGGLRDGTFTGATATYAYGSIRVTITVTDGRVSDVSATYPTDNPTTRSVNERAIPKLRQEALTAQSANISTVSGASLTSEAYQASLQSALDRARA